MGKDVTATYWESCSVAKDKGTIKSADSFIGWDGAGGIGQLPYLFIALESDVAELGVVDLRVAIVSTAGLIAELSNHVDEESVDKLEGELTGAMLC